MISEDFFNYVTNEPDSFDDIYQEYINFFGKKPNIVGMYWNNQEMVEENIKKAIKDNKPYDEYELLTDEEKKLFDKGDLFF